MKKDLKNILVSVVIAAVLLVLFGLAKADNVNSKSIISPLVILSIFGFVFYKILPRVDKKIVNLAAKFGLIAGIIFAGEIILEYIVLPKDNTTFGLVEFVAVFLVLLLSSAYATFKTKSIKSGLKTAILTSLIADIIWVVTFLVLFYVFFDTARADMIHKAEGDFLDFAASGAKNFNTFIIEDYFGAVFFHSLLSPIFAFVLGLMGAVTAKVVLFGKKLLFK